MDETHSRYIKLAETYELRPYGMKKGLITSVTSFKDAQFQPRCADTFKYILYKNITKAQTVVWTFGCATNFSLCVNSDTGNVTKCMTTQIRQR